MRFTLGTDVRRTRALLTAIVIAVAVTPAGAATTAPPRVKAPAPPALPSPAGSFPDASGNWANFPGAPANQNNPFFVPLGSNARTCATCHSPTDSWSATPGALQKRFAATSGADPIFLSLDGTNCPSLPVTTTAQQQAASSLLLNYGLIRIQLVPPDASEFAVAKVANPYGCNSTSAVSVYRRILPSANLAFLSDVMWDGRETTAGASVYADLVTQANGAVAMHAAATKAAPASSVDAAVALELEQFTAQIKDNAAGLLSASPVSGGPAALSTQAFTPGENLGVLAPVAFTVYQAWENIAAPANATAAAQASIGRGEKIFNTRPMSITKVAGLNDVGLTGAGPEPMIVGTCSTCHNSSNAGSHSTALLVDEGQARVSSSVLPLITLVNNRTKASISVTDPGAALTTGKWADIGKFKVPTLRGLAGRAPYFHNGSARKLDDVVNFYNTRFNLNLSAGEHADLVAFLSAL